MCEKTRHDAYREAQADPYRYLSEHFGIIPGDSKSRIQKEFVRFRTNTGPSASLPQGQSDVEEAVSTFMHEQELPEWVLQAASWEVEHSLVKS